MTLWLLFAVLLIAALGFVVLPLYRRSERLTPVLAGSIVLIVALSAGLYAAIGSPGVKSGAAPPPDVNAMVASLAERLQREPNDVEGWLMLARSYETLERYPEAADAYEKVLELQPDNATALFYGGYIAAGRGELELAAQRWEALLRAGQAPEDVRESMQRQIDVWRGREVPPDRNAVTAESAATIVTVDVSLSTEAAAVLPASAVVYVIARDPQQPSPPIAVARRALAELPISVSLSDRDAMVPGRNLSAYAEFEVIVRASVGGGPIAQPGDWYVSQVVSEQTIAAADGVIALQISELVE